MRKIMARWGKATYAAKKTLYGQLALNASCKQFESDIASGKVKTLRELQIHRAYSWTMTASMREMSGQWIRDALQLCSKSPSAAIADTP